MQRYSYTVQTHEVNAVPGPALRPSDAIAAHCRWAAPDDAREHLVVFALDAHGVPLGYSVIASGTVDAVMLYPRDIFAWALLVPLVRYVGVAHNHPSGDVTPSPQDIGGTASVAAAGRLLGLDLVWSIVFTHRSEAWKEVPMRGQRKREPGEDQTPERPEPVPEEPEEDQPEPDGQPDEPEDEPEEGGIEPEPDGPEGTPGGGREGDTEVTVDDVKAALRRLIAGGEK